jgi:hypothetical protein
MGYACLAPHLLQKFELRGNSAPHLMHECLLRATCVASNADQTATRPMQITAKLANEFPVKPSASEAGTSVVELSVNVWA